MRSSAVCPSRIHLSETPCLGMRNSETTAERVQDCDHFPILETQSYYTNSASDLEIKQMVQIPGSFSTSGIENSTSFVLCKSGEMICKFAMQGKNGPVR